MRPSVAPVTLSRGWVALEEVSPVRRAPRLVEGGEGLPRPLTRWGYGYDPVVVAFLHDLRCPACAELVQLWAECRAAYGAYEAVLVAITPRSCGVRAEGVWVLSDTEGVLRDRYAAWCPRLTRGGVSVLILDAYAAGWALWQGPEADPDQIHRGALEWLAFMSLQCPE